MGTRCRTGWNSPRGAAPTVCVGESGVTRVGYVGLELPELEHQEVVLGVGDLRRVEHVVPLVVVLDQLAQLGRPGRRFGRRVAGRPARRPCSGGDAGADHGVGIGGVVQGDRLPGCDRALGRVELDDQPGVRPGERARRRTAVGADLGHGTVTVPRAGGPPR